MTNEKDGRTGELRARAATQHGETGDKIPGFDPAMAPMETDAEAGGATFGGPAEPLRARPARPPETATASAMRPTPGLHKPRNWPALFTVAALAAAILLALLAVMS